MADSGNKKPAQTSATQTKFILYAIIVLALGVIGFCYALPVLVRHMIPPMPAEHFEAHQQEALDAMNKAIDICQSQYTYGELKTYQQEAECAVPGIVDAFRNAGFPYMDLIQAFAAERVEIGRKLDRKEITQVEAQGEDDKFLDQLHNEARARGKAARQ